MFKKSREERKGGGKELLNQMGLGMAHDDDDDDDAELEAELLALQGGYAAPSPKKSKGKGGVSSSDLDKMVAASIRDIDIEEDVSDTEDPELLMELAELADSDPAPVPARAAPVPPGRSSTSSVLPLLENRLQMYQQAYNSARDRGDTSKANRIDRGTKTLTDLVRKAKAGKPVAEEDIPPAISMSSSQIHTPAPPDHKPSMVFEPTTSGTVQPTTQPQPSVPVMDTKPPLSREDAEKRKELTDRRDQYKKAALKAKHNKDDNTARKHIRVAKQFDAVINALDEGKPIDLSQMPPPPSDDKPSAPPAGVQRASTQGASNVQKTPEEEELPTLTTEDKQKLFKAPETAGSVMEALQQRLEKYQTTANQAKEEGNNSKAKRMGRITKQYQDAIKAYKAGKAVDYEELPTPPGFPPIPVGASPAKTASGPPPGGSPTKQVNQLRAPGQATPTTPSPNKVAVPQKRVSPQGLQRQTSLLSKSEQSALFLQERQLIFKKAALKAKNEGDYELAKKYLKMAKGFDRMIDACQAGLPVDMSQVPALPDGFNSKSLGFVEAPKDDNQPVGDRNEMYKKLEQELIQQIRTCTTNADHFTRLGDVSSAGKFDRIGQNARKDLDALKNAYKHGDPVPRFHYENRTFTLVQCCTDMGDNDLEIVIVRGMNYSTPSGYKPEDMDTYIKYEFPFPTEGPQKGETDVCKHTENPEYNQSFKLQINRKSRVFLRLLKSNKTAKFEIYYKRGFFKGDKLLGVVNVKLQELESQCVLHDCYDLMDNRKAVGGKLELKIRVRHPFISKQVEEVKERWLIIDHFERKLPERGANTNAQKTATKTFVEAPTPPSTGTWNSIKVLEYEKTLLDQRIRQYQNKLTPTDLASLQDRTKQLNQEIFETTLRLQKGGLAAQKAYCDALEKLKTQYHAAARAQAQQGNKEKEHIFLAKRTLLEQEIAHIRSKMPS